MHQHLLRLSDEAAALDNRMEGAVAKMEAETAEGDRAKCREVYLNLVACQRELNAMRAALTTPQLAGWSVVESVWPGRALTSEACGMHARLSKHCEEPCEMHTCSHG